MSERPRCVVTTGPSVLPSAALAEFAADGVIGCWYRYEVNADGSGTGAALVLYHNGDWDLVPLDHPTGASPLRLYAPSPEVARFSSLEALEASVTLSKHVSDLIRIARPMAVLL